MEETSAVLGNGSSSIRTGGNVSVGDRHTRCSSPWSLPTSPSRRDACRGPAAPERQRENRSVTGRASLPRSSAPLANPQVGGWGISSICRRILTLHLQGGRMVLV